MAKNKTAITSASVDDFINQVPDMLKRQDSHTIVELFKNQTGLKPEMWGASIMVLEATIINMTVVMRAMHHWPDFLHARQLLSCILQVNQK